MAVPQNPLAVHVVDVVVADDDVVRVVHLDGVLGVRDLEPLDDEPAHDVGPVVEPLNEEPLSRTSTVSPGAASSAALPIVLKGRASVPGLVLAPLGET
jgi:hypothetical protein